MSVPARPPAPAPESPLIEFPASSTALFPLLEFPSTPPSSSLPEFPATPVAPPAPAPVAAAPPSPAHAAPPRVARASAAHPVPQTPAAHETAGGEITGTVALTPGTLAALGLQVPTPAGGAAPAAPAPDTHFPPAAPVPDNFPPAAPAPVKPAAAPAPVAPSPVAPLPVAPSPVAPPPVAPSPVASVAKPAPAAPAPAAPAVPAAAKPATPAVAKPAATPAVAGAKPAAPAPEGAAVPAHPGAPAAAAKPGAPAAEKAHAEPQHFPEVVVELFPGDESLSPRALRALSMFRREPRDDTFEQWLKKAEDWLDDRPGALVLRRFSAEELVCEEGEAGWTAFYILTTEEMHALRASQISETAAALPMAAGIRRATLEASLAGWRREQAKLEERLARLREAAATLQSTFPEHAKKRPSELWALADEEQLRGASTKAAALRGAAAQAIAATVSLSSVEEPAAPAGFLERLMKKSKKDAYKDTRSIPIDGPADLDRSSRKGVMFEGELFGEMTCRFRTPRSASVQTTRDVYMLELLPHVFEKLLDDLPVRKGVKGRDPSPLKAFLDQIYKERTLATQLRNHPVFGGLPPEASAEFARELKPGADFPEFDAGQTIFKQGDVADALYVVRVGVVRVEQAGVVLAYKGRGEVIGEMGVLENKPRTATCIAYAHPTQTKGKTRVSLVRITKEVFDRVLRKHVQPRVEALVAERRAQRDASRGRALDIRGPLEDLGIPQGERLMLIDLDRCTRCDECVKACASTHADGRSRLFREGPVFERFLVPASCRQCRDPVCTIGCPVGAIHKGDKGNIVIESWCVGCELCSNSCPYGSIVMHDRRPEEQPPPGTRVLKPLIANVCDQCQTSNGGTPSCVYACPHGAALRVDALEFMDLRQKALELRQNNLAARAPGAKV